MKNFKSIVKLYSKLVILSLLILQLPAYCDNWAYLNSMVSHCNTRNQFQKNICGALIDSELMGFAIGVWKTTGQFPVSPQSYPNSHEEISDLFVAWYKDTRKKLPNHRRKVEFDYTNTADQIIKFAYDEGWIKFKK